MGFFVCHICNYIDQNGRNFIANRILIFTPRLRHRRCSNWRLRERTRLFIFFFFLALPYYSIMLDRGDTLNIFEPLIVFSWICIIKYKFINNLYNNRLAKNKEFLSLFKLFLSFSHYNFFRHLFPNHAMISKTKKSYATWLGSTFSARSFFISYQNSRTLPIRALDTGYDDDNNFINVNGSNRAVRVVVRQK